MRDEPRRDQLDRILAVVRDVLRPQLIGVYLYGSAVAGRLHPRSDVDVLVVSSQRTTVASKRRLVAGLVPISRRGRRPAGFRPVELTVVALPDVRPWGYPPRADFQYGEWLRDAFDAGDLEPASVTHRDLAVLLTMVLLDGRPLYGPPAAEILDPVPRDDLVRGMLDGIGALLEDLEQDAANVVLTLARIWTTIATGHMRSKDEAAEWVLARLPAEHRQVLARARDDYLGRYEDRWDDLADRLGPYADHLVDEIERAAAGPTEKRPMRR